MHVIGSVSRPLVEIPKSLIKKHKTTFSLCNQELRNFKFFSTSQDNAMLQKQQATQDTTSTTTNEEIARARDNLISKLKKKLKNSPKNKISQSHSLEKDKIASNSNWTKKDKKIMKEAIKDSMSKSNKYDIDKDGKLYFSNKNILN